MRPLNPINSPGDLVKTAQQASSHLSRAQKAAIIIGLLGPDTAKPIIGNFDDRYLRTFIDTLANINHVPRPVMLSVVADFLTDLKSRSDGFQGGERNAHNLAKSLLDDDRVANLLGRPAPPAHVQNTKTDSVWSMFELQKTEDVIRFLEAQRPEVVAIILSQMSSGKVGEFLAELSEPMSVFCVEKLSQKQNVDADTLAAIGEYVRTEFLEASQVDEGAQAAAMVSEVLSILPKGRRDVALEHLKQKDPEQAKRIEQGMMTFEDVPKRVPASVAPIIFRDYAQDDLIKALKAGADAAAETVEFLYANISQRMAEQYKEQVEELGPLSEKESDSAVSGLMSFISKLEKDGRITLIKPETE